MRYSLAIFSVAVVGFVGVRLSTLTASLSDVPGTPYETAFGYLVQHGIVEGYSDGTGRPYGMLRRSEAVAVIIRSNPDLMKRVVAYEKNMPPAERFIDNDRTQWYAPYLLVAYEEGIVKGYPDGSIRPQQLLQAQEAIALLLRAQKIAVKDDDYLVSPLIENRLGEWFTPFITSAIRLNLILDDRKLIIGKAITRGQFFDMLYRVLELQRTGAASFVPSAGVVPGNLQPAPATSPMHSLPVTISPVFPSPPQSHSVQPPVFQPFPAEQSSQAATTGGTPETGGSGLPGAQNVPPQFLAPWPGLGIQPGSGPSIAPGPQQFGIPPTGAQPMQPTTPLQQPVTQPSAPVQTAPPATVTDHGSSSSTKKRATSPIDWDAYYRRLQEEKERRKQLKSGSVPVSKNQSSQGMVPVSIEPVSLPVTATPQPSQQTQVPSVISGQNPLGSVPSISGGLPPGQSLSILPQRTTPQLATPSTSTAPAATTGVPVPSTQPTTVSSLPVFASPQDFAISLPSLGIENLRVSHPEDPSSQEGILSVLDRGVGHLFSFPGGGGKIMIYGHSSSYWWDRSEYTRVFRRINELKPGDRVYVTFDKTLYAYEVTHHNEIAASDMSAFLDFGEELILYTCWPPDSIAKRYLVHAKPVGQQKVTDSTGSSVLSPRA